MKLTRLYTGDDGESHFEDVEVSLKDAGVGILQRSKISKATGVFFSVTNGPFYSHWHNAPRRQYIIILEGEVEVGIGDGTKRQFGPGDILLVEDAAGRGHTTRSVNDQFRREVFVTLD
jgi:quercetin dioxygenase-like cupin family protein